MNKSVAGKNVVFVGNFLPSNFDKLFFIKKDIFKEDEFLSPSVFNPDIVQILTKDVTIIVLVNQIIITQNNIENNRAKDIAVILINSLKPYVTALGINFTWNIKPEENLEKETRNLFFNRENKVFSNFFDVPDAVFGSYTSKNIKNGRLKLEMKPQILKQLNTKEIVESFVSYVFNFHFEIDTPENYGILLEAVDNYDGLFTESKKIMSIYE